MIASRQLAARPGAVWKELEKEGAIVITRDGHPCSIMLPTSDATMVEDIEELVFARARKAVSEIRRDASSKGTCDLSIQDIDDEIARARKERRKGTSCD